ncbi:diguanylate cyclase [Allosaccharopolyspora coralli]|uniref:Diguanylate cyclase n=1 Tax=Allosaccharopolyspora coralli TaxID=2665642 RepID=A0A5Q3QJX2_9PSEU|nr:GGDEF domain-containing protein [Allosaccharopolyspora coralli]QGK71739.1 diguanylate cyclase [Allosaccharopolyspora coralli]
MTGLRSSFVASGRQRSRDADRTPPALPDQYQPGGHQDSTDTGLVELHESIATLLASRGQWRQAYHHLRSALDILSAENTPEVPQQLRTEVDRLRKEHAEAREQSLRDSLTECFNRRYLDERLNQMLDSGNGLAVALVDLDWFKQVNDTHGHVLGDRVLQRVVDLLQQSLPAGAFCARYGGEEFVLVLPGIDPTSAVGVCEAARARVERYPWQQLQRGLRITVSIGVTYESGSLDGTPPTDSEHQLLNADALLYSAKQSGRNAVAYRTNNEVRLAGFAAARRTAPRSNALGY